MLVVVVVVLSIGVLPSPRSLSAWLGMGGGERYPCEECGCGCASARECWTNCCCHSEVERLAWAIANGIAPPEGVTFDDEVWIAAANAVVPGSASCGVCAARVRRETAEGVAKRPRSDAISAASTDQSCGAPAPADTAGLPAAGRSALACKSLHQLLSVSLPPAFPPAIADLLPPAPRAPEPPRLCDEARAPTRALDVPTPPPRGVMPA